MILPNGIGVLASGRHVFTPPSPANLKLWVRPESLSGLNNDDPVASWSDESGNGNHLSDGSVPEQPLYKTNQLNGHAGVQFDGVNDRLTAVVLSTNTIYTMFVVAKFFSATGTEALFRVGEGGGYGMLKDAGSREVLHRVVAALTDGAATTSAELWSAVRTSAPLAKFFVNGVQKTITNDTSAVNAPDAITYLGIFNPGAGLYFSGQVYEILSYDTNLSDADRQLVENYLIAKYAL